MEVKRIYKSKEYRETSGDRLTIFDIAARLYWKARTGRWFENLESSEYSILVSFNEENSSIEVKGKTLPLHEMSSKSRQALGLDQNKYHYFIRKSDLARVINPFEIPAIAYASTENELQKKAPKAVDTLRISLVESSNDPPKEQSDPPEQ